MATAANERRSFGVFWDIENCRVPKGGSARELVGRIRRKLYSTESDREAEFMCVCDASKENKELMKELNSAQVTIVHVDATNKNAADEKLRQRMRYFVETHKPPATVVLISGDVNFEGLLSDIQHRNQLDTILIHPDRINEGLRQCVQQRFPYTDFANKLPSRQANSKTLEHDCVILGLPCGRDSKALSARLHQLSENCGGKVLSVVPPRARIRFKDLELAERAGGRMNGEDVFGTKIKVEIAPTPVNIYPEHHYNNGHQSPRSKTARKKLRKKRGAKSDYHSSDGSGNSPQSSPQGSPKSSPFRQRSPGRNLFTQHLSNEGNSPLCTASPPRVAMPPYSDIHDKFDTEETIVVVTSSKGAAVTSLSPLHHGRGDGRGRSSTPEICNGKFSPAIARRQYSTSSSVPDDGDSEMEGIPWNQQHQQQKVAGVSSSPRTGEQLTQQAPVSAGTAPTRERHNSYTPNCVYKKQYLPPRIRTYSDPPISHSQPQSHYNSSQRNPDRGLNDTPTRSFYRHSSQPGSPFRDPRGRGYRGCGGGGRGTGGPGRRFTRSRSNSSNRSNQSSPSLSDSGDRLSVDAASTDMPPSQPNFTGGSPPTFSTSHSPRRGNSGRRGCGGHSRSTPANSPRRQQKQAHGDVSSPEDFHLRVTNLDNKKDVKELKDELKKYFQRHAKVEDIAIECQPDSSVVAIVKVSTLKAAERAAAKLHRTTKIGCKRIHVYLRQPPSVTNKLRANVVELLKEIPGHSLKWFKFVDLYEKRYQGRVALVDVEQLGGEVMVLNTEQSGHSVQLVRHTTQPQDTTTIEEGKKPSRWGPGQVTTASPASKNNPDKATPPSTTGQALTTAEPPPETPVIAEFEQQVFTDLCSLHCPKSSPAVAEAGAAQSLPSVQVHRKPFAAQVHTLLLGHNGSMPLKSFMVCYLAEFPPLLAGEVPLDHLISAIPGVCITAPDSPVRHVRWAANQGQASIVHPPPHLVQFAAEVTKVLTAVPQCMLRLSEFLPKYQATHGKACCFSDYGHRSLHDLLAALPQVVQIFGWGSCRQVSLTHQVQLQRFVSDLVTVLRQQPQWHLTTDHLPNAFYVTAMRPRAPALHQVVLREVRVYCSYVKVTRTLRSANWCKADPRGLILTVPCMIGNTFRKAFNVSDYGVCYIEDLIADLPGNVILVSHKDGIQALELTRQEVLLELERRVVGALQDRDQGVALPVFLSVYYERHQVNLSLADYGVTSVRELIQLLPDSITIERNSGRDVISLLDDCNLHLKTLCARQVLAAYPDTILTCSEFVDRYSTLYGERLDVDELSTVLQGLAEVTRDETGSQVIQLLPSDAISGHGQQLPLLDLGGTKSDMYRSPTAITNIGLSTIHNVLSNAPMKCKESIGKNSVCPSKNLSSDICGNSEATQTSPRSELENAAQHLKNFSSLSTPTTTDNAGKIEHARDDPTSLLDKEVERIDAASGLYHTDMAMNNCKSLGECAAKPPSSLKMVTKELKSTAPSSSASESTTNTSNTEAVAMVTVSEADQCQASVAPKGSGDSPPQSATNQSTGRRSCSRVASSRPGSRTASNSSGSPLGSPLSYPGTPRKNRLAARFTNAVIPTVSPLPVQSDSDV